MSDVFAPFTLPLRREADALIVDATGKTILVIDPSRDLEEDQAEAIADLVFAALSAAAPIRNGGVPRGPGHCDDDAAWTEFCRQYDGKPRSLPALTDFALANAVFMASRDDLSLIHYQTAAKERIRWLSIELAKAQALHAPAEPIAREGDQPVEAILQAFSDGAFAVGGAVEMDDPAIEHVIEQAWDATRYAAQAAPSAGRDEILEEAAAICEDITSWGLSPTKAEVAKSTQTFCAKAIRAQKSEGAK